MLSKKYFLAGELNFSTPLVRPARANVTDHIESQESDHTASYMSYRGLQQRRQLKTDFREFWELLNFRLLRPHRSLGEARHGQHGRDAVLENGQHVLERLQRRFENPMVCVTTYKFVLAQRCHTHSLSRRRGDWLNAACVRNWPLADITLAKETAQKTTGSKAMARKTEEAVKDFPGGRPTDAGQHTAEQRRSNGRSTRIRSSSHVISTRWPPTSR